MEKDQKKSQDSDVDFQSELPDCSITKTQAAKPPKKVQRTIFASLNWNEPKNVSKPKHKPTTARQPEPSSSTAPTKQKLNPKQAAPSTSKTPTRTVSKETVEKWKAELAVHQVADWLIYDTNLDGTVKSFKCKVCTQFVKDIEGLPNFSDLFIKGSTNFKKSAVVDHATKSKHHLKALNLYLKGKGASASEISRCVSTSVAPHNKDIVAGLETMEKTDFERTKKKFEVAYFVAKHNMPLSSYADILDLEEKHKVDVKGAYKNDKACGTFIEYMGDDLKRNLNVDLANAKFFSVLCDGSTDSAVIEEEVIYALYFDPSPANSDSVQIKTSFLHMHQMRHQNADGIASTLQTTLKESVENGFRSIGIKEISSAKKLIGFTSDGASVNRGDKRSVKTILREEQEWLVFTWCVAHRLELALSDALTGTKFDDIDELILRLYYLYQKAPKKLQELRELFDVFKGAMDYMDGSCKPKKASGTRWISHKLNAMKNILDKWGLYMTHLESLSQDKKVPSKDRSKLSGYLSRWKQGRIPLMLAFFIDLLDIPAVLSKSFQDNEIDPVYAIQALNKCKTRLELFETKQFEKLPYVKYFLSQVEERNDGSYYQGFRLSNFEQAKKTLAGKKSDFTNKVSECIRLRLEEEADSTEIFTHAPKILNTEGWLQYKEDTEFADEGLEYLFNHFKIPLTNAGVTASFPELLTQWQNLLEYANEFLSISNTSYKKTWYRIFNSPRKTQWKDILIMVELIFTIPVSNAKLERMFSKMKHVKTLNRSALKEKKLEAILRILEEGPPLQTYDPTPAIQLWMNAKYRRPNQRKRKTYKKREGKKSKIGSLSDSDTMSEQETENENTDETSLFDVDDN